MAEYNSRTAAAISSGKVTPAEANGKLRMVTIRTPATHNYAATDTMVGGVKIPAGSVIMPECFIGHEAMGATVTIDVGLRNFHTQAEVDLDGLLDALAVSTATEGNVPFSGVLCADVAPYTTTVDTELVITWNTAAPTDDAQLWVGIMIASND